MPSSPHASGTSLQMTCFLLNYLDATPSGQKKSFPHGRHYAEVEEHSVTAFKGAEVNGVLLLPRMVTYPDRQSANRR